LATLQWKISLTFTATLQYVSAKHLTPTRKNGYLEET